MALKPSSIIPAQALRGSYPKMAAAVLQQAERLVSESVGVIKDVPRAGMPERIARHD
jgi:hypothetical protein